MRPQESWLASTLRSAILLRVTEQDGNSEPKQVAVWTAHNLEKSDFEDDARTAAQLIAPLRPMDANLKNGLILTPAHGDFAYTSAEARDKQVDLVALDPFGTSLRFGMNKIGSILRSQALGR